MSVKLIHCGMCSHSTDLECIKKECDCCSNFHIQAGQQNNLN